MTAMTSEREAFEKWATERELMLGTSSDGYYASVDTRDAWSGWSARAHLSQPAQPVMVPDVEAMTLEQVRDWHRTEHKRCEKAWWYQGQYKAMANAINAHLAQSAQAVDGEKCWALHFKGPDDVVAAPSREAAEIVARNFNAYWEAHRHERKHDVRIVAEVIEWEHGAVEHAKSAAQHWPEYAELLTAALPKDSNGAEVVS